MIPKAIILFEVRRRLKLWVVMKDDVYDGSFPEEAGAIEAAHRQIRAIVNSGGRAQMAISTDLPSMRLNTVTDTRRKPGA